MTQEQRDLLNAVLASPDDDLPRLVYADWLDEHDEPTPCGCDDGVIDTGDFDPAGNPVYVECGICDGVGHLPNQNALHAALIRTQCTIAGAQWDCEWMTRGLNCQRWNQDIKPWKLLIWCPTCKALQELTDEEDRIKSQLRMPFWEGEQPGESSGTCGLICRGFIDEVIAPFDWLQQHLPDIVQYHPVQMVRVPGYDPYPLGDDHYGWQSWPEYGRWDYIPVAVMQTMVDLGIGHPGRYATNGFRVRIFPDRDAAYAGLSQALLHMARKQAGMFNLTTTKQ